MIRPIAYARFGLSIAADVAAEIVQEFARPIDAAARGLEHLAAVLDPGEEYVPIVKPLTDAMHYWQGEEFALAFDIIERTRDIAENPQTGDQA